MKCPGCCFAAIKQRGSVTGRAADVGDGGGFEKYGRQTRRAGFLAAMDLVVLWPELVALIEPHYPKAPQGHPPVGVERMLRIYFLQQLFNLSNLGVEDALYDSNAMRGFVGIDLGRESRYRMRRRCASSAICWSGISWAGASSPRSTPICHSKDYRSAPSPSQTVLGCDDLAGAVFDQDAAPGTRPGDAPGEQGQAVVLRHGSACGCGRSDQADSLCRRDRGPHRRQVTPRQSRDSPRQKKGSRLGSPLRFC